jgi:hypothetical protein
MSLFIFSKTTVIANGAVSEVRKLRVSPDNRKSWRDAKRDSTLDEVVAELKAQGFEATERRSVWRSTGPNSGFATEYVHLRKIAEPIPASKPEAPKAEEQPKVKKPRKTRKKNSEQVAEQLA